jgi:hypothetical protein
MITSGTLPVVAGRNTDMPMVEFANTTAYASYKVIFPTNQGSATSIQLSEFDLLVPEPTTLGATGTFALGLLRRRRLRG